jgi:hypothetical protein
MRLHHFALPLALLAVLAGGCANQLRGMRAVPPGQVNARPPADRAAVVFLRPSTSTGAHSASLFELRPGAEDRFVGILVAETQLVDHVPAGRTRFMVLGRGAEFLDADLEAGKTYRVALLPPPPGTSDSFFTLVPVRGTDLRPWPVRQCTESCGFVENTERSRAWAQRTWSSIQRKKAAYLPKWEARADRPALRAADGR